MRIEPVRLEGPRVVVRTACLDDARRFVAYFDRNRAHLEPWEPARDVAFYTESYWTERIRGYEEDLERGTGHRFAVFERGEDELAGNIGVFEIIARDPVWRGRVGYSLDAKKEGRGIMGEALGLVTRYAFDVLHLKRIQAGYIPRNVRSARVLERAGFVKEGYYREYLRVGGEWNDHIDTSLINAAWRAPTP
ncbi:MAG TPA: GNAT family N-acetyltransferase [Polyangiaceae bacterium]|jgi:ribosomal-protein-alanine N-acetyltransferase